MFLHHKMKATTMYALLFFACGTVTGWTMFDGGPSYGETENNHEDGSQPLGENANSPEPAEYAHNSFKQSSSDALPLFEMLTTDDKFLSNAANANQFLDACHSRVIAELQGKKCSELTEVELSKLSVQLMNCQLAVEGRLTYLCTSDMTIKECTIGMDGSMWSAYQTVSNRARAICYSARQNFFRAKTEHTIDLLVATTHDQLLTMQEMQHNHEKVREMAVDTLGRLEDGQDRIVQKQQDLAELLRLQIAENVAKLQLEQSQISAENQEILRVAEAANSKLDSTHNQLEAHRAEEAARHGALTADLVNLHSAAQGVFLKLDTGAKIAEQLYATSVEHYKQTLNTMKEIEMQRSEEAARHNELSSDLAQLHYTAQGVVVKLDSGAKAVEQTLSAVREVNNTIRFLSGTMSQMSEAIEIRLAWILEIIGAADNRLNVVTMVAQHAAYFFATIFLCGIFQAPLISRLSLLVLVLGNAFLAVRYDYCFTFTSITSATCASTVVYGIYVGLWLRYSVTKTPSCQRSAAASKSSLTTARPVDFESQIKRDIYQIVYGYISSLKQVQNGAIQLPAPSPATIGSPYFHSIRENSPTVLSVRRHLLKSLDIKRSSAPPSPVSAEDFCSSQVGSLMANDQRRPSLLGISQARDVYGSQVASSVARDRYGSPAGKSVASGSQTNLLFPGDQVVSRSTARSSTPDDARASRASTIRRTRSSSRSSISSRNSLNGAMSMRPPCLAATKAGQPCKLSCDVGSAFCHVHHGYTGDTISTLNDSRNSRGSVNDD